MIKNGQSKETANSRCGRGSMGKIDGSKTTVNNRNGKA
jgi:hypothetical protein